MILFLNQYLKINTKLLPFLALFVGLQTYAQDQSFETTVPSNWSTTNGTLNTSTDHYKLDNQSLEWNWTANAVITVNDLQSSGLVPSEVYGYNYNMFRMWVYNTSATSVAPMIVEFYDNTNTLQAYYSFQLDFTGWRAVSASYVSEMSGVKSSSNITSMKIKAPNSSSGTIFFDLIDYTMSRNTVRSADYQLPFITLDNDEHWGDIMYFQSLPKTESLVIPTAQELLDLATIKQKYDDLILGSAPNSSSVTNAISQYNALNISYSGGLIKGNPIYGLNFPSSENIKVVDNFVLILAKDFKHTSSTSSKDYFLNTIRFILDQGYADGSAMERIQLIGYSIRNTVSAIHLMKNELEVAGLWSEAQKMVEWYTALDGIWEPTASSSNLDDAITRSKSRLGACLYKTTDAEKVQYLKGHKSYLEIFLTLYPKEGEGMKTDFTGFHHNTYYPGYTFLAYNEMSEVINVVSEGLFAISTTAKETLKKSLMLARVTTASGDIPNSLSGRNPFHSPSIEKGLKNLGLATPVDTDLIEAHNYMFGSDSETSSYGNETPPNGFWQANFSNLGVYRQSNWVVDIKGFNKYFWGAEIYSSENRFGRYQSYGAVEVMYQGGYDNSKFNIDGWDWTRTPGATTKHLSWNYLEASNSRQDEQTDSNFAASLRFGTKNDYYIDQNIEGNYGVFGMDFNQKNISSTHDTTFEFKKSVFCFDGKLICLGSNINSNTSLIATNLFQNYLSSTSTPININNTLETTFPYNNTLSIATNNWIIDAANTGYFVKSGNSIVIDRQSQNSPSETGNGTFTNEDFASAYISHGTAPSNAGYEYVIIPNANSTDMVTFSANMGNTSTAFYEVIQKNQTAHIVKYNDVYGYSLFEDGSYGTNTPIKDNFGSCLVMAEELGDNLNLSVVSPDLNFAANNGNSQTSTIELTINGEWTLDNSSGGVVNVIVNTGDTTLIIDAKSGLPVDVSLSNSYVNPDYSIVYYEDFRLDSGNNGFSKHIVSDGGHTNTSSILTRVSDIPDLADTNNQFNPGTDRSINRIPQGDTNDQRSISISGDNGTTNFPVDAYAVFTTLDLTDANARINASDTYKYASFWTERRYGNGDIASVDILVSTVYTGDPTTTTWTTLPLHSGKLAKTSDGLNFVKGIVDLSSYANGPNGSAVTLAYRYQSSSSAYSGSNRNGTFYFSDLQFYVQSTMLSVANKVLIDDGVLIYPNPTKNILNIRISDSNIQINRVQIIDMSGKIIFANSGAKSIDVNNFAKGFYFIKIETNKGIIFNKKFIVN